MGPVRPPWCEPLQRRAAGNPQPANTGPDVSPTTNPPYPENPVNGAPDGRAARRRSTSCRSAAGRRATRTRASSRSCRHRSRSATPAPAVTREPRAAAVPPRRDGQADRRAERRLRHPPGHLLRRRDGGRQRRLAALRSRVHAARGRALRHRATVAATAEDSLGQTATGTAHAAPVDVRHGPPRTQPPTVELPREPADDPAATARPSRSTPVAEQGVDERRVLPRHAPRLPRHGGAVRVPHQAAAPSEIGSQTVRVVVTDTGRPDRPGQPSGRRSRASAPRALKLEVARKRLAGNRVRRTVTAIVIPPTGVKRAAACARRPRRAPSSSAAATTLARPRDRARQRCRARVTAAHHAPRRSRALRYKATRPLRRHHRLGPRPQDPEVPLMPSPDHPARPGGDARARPRRAARRPRAGARPRRRRPGRLHRRGRLRPGDPDLPGRRRSPAGRRADGQQRARPDRRHLQVLRRRARRPRRATRGCG